MFLMLLMFFILFPPYRYDISDFDLQRVVSDAWPLDKKEEKMFNYYGSKWKKKRKRILRIDGYVDQIEKRYGRTVAANTVHHIYPAEEYPEYAWLDWNLISVSQATHNKIENRKSGELTAFGLALQRKTKPGVDWRKRKNE